MTWDQNDTAWHFIFSHTVSTKSEIEMLEDIDITPEIANALGRAYSYLLERRKGRKVAPIGVVELSPYPKTEVEYVSRPIVEELADNL